MPTFVSCPSCQCAVKSSERACPHCGVAFSRASHVKTAAAIMLGLATVAAGCGDDTSGNGGNGGAGGSEVGGAPEGGAAEGGAPEGGAAEGGAAEGGAGEGGFAADYGVPGTGGLGGGN